MPLRGINIVLWLAQIFFTLFPAWFLYLQHHQAKRSGYRERSALPFAAALFTWTIAAVINAVVAYLSLEKSSADSTTIIEDIRVQLSTINTLFLTVGVVRLDNFPNLLLGRFLTKRSNRFWIVLTVSLISAEACMAQFGSGLQRLRIFDAIVGLIAVIPLTIGLRATFLKYEMGKMLTAAIVGALWLLEGVLIYVTWEESTTSKLFSTDAGELFLTSLMVTSKTVFMMVLVMLAAAWGRYYISATIEELKEGGLPQRVRPLFEVIPGGEMEAARDNAYETIVAYWPDSPALLAAIKTEGPSSKEVIAAFNTPEMIADMIQAGILKLNLSQVAEGITTELINASARAKEDEDGQEQYVAS